MKRISYIKLAEDFIGKEGEGRNHNGFDRFTCPLCKEVKDFARYLEKIKRV